MKKLTLKTKLAGGFGTLLLIMATMGVVSYSAIQKLSDLTDEVSKQMLKKQYALEMNSGLETQTSGTRGYLVFGRDKELQHRQEGLDQFVDRIAKLEQLLQTPAGKALGSRIETEGKELQEVQGRAIELRRDGKMKDAADTLFADQAVSLRADLEKSVGEMIALIDKLQQGALSEHEAVENKTVELICALAVIGILVGIAVAVLIVGSISKAISDMLAVIEEIAGKNLTIDDIVVTTEDEIGKAGLALNQMKASLHDVMRSISETAQQVASASEELSATSQQITANSEETSAQAGVVTQAAQQVNSNLQSVSAGGEEMATTIQSIASNAHEAATVASRAVQTAQTANTTIGKLGESSAEIGEVIKVITSIAQQTKLLALNATIEAARAGEAGKGFAVVANEVKELARQTAKATEDISRKIIAIQADTSGAVEAIGTISTVINQINDISGTIATSVEEQSATTNEMTRNVADAAKGSGEISNNIAGVAEAAQGTSTSAQQSQKAANDLADMAAQLRSLVEQFQLKTSSTQEQNRSQVQAKPRAMAAGAGR